MQRPILEKAQELKFLVVLGHPSVCASYPLPTSVRIVCSYAYDVGNVTVHHQQCCRFLVTAWEKKFQDVTIVPLWSLSRNYPSPSSNPVISFNMVLAHRVSAGPGLVLRDNNYIRQAGDFV